MPKVMIRLAAGRGRYEDNGEAALAAGANAVISGDFLTTDGTSFDLDFDMIRRNGFVTDRKHSKTLVGAPCARQLEEMD